MWRGFGIAHGLTADAARSAHARYFAGREADVLALWDSSRQCEAYEWYALELPNLRMAIRWAADHGDLDSAVAIAFYAALLGFWVEQMEPVVRAHHGFIDKDIGDAIMALFSGPPDDAVRASIGMLVQLAEYNRGRATAGYKPIEIGIGLNTGVLMLGTVG